MLMMYVCVHVHRCGCIHVVVHDFRNHVSNLGLRILLDVDVRSRLQVVDNRVKKNFYRVHFLEHLWVDTKALRLHYHELWLLRPYSLSVVFLTSSLEGVGF